MTSLQAQTVLRILPLSTVIVLTIVLVTDVLGATSRIEGTVRDARTGDPLPGANVIIEGTGFGAATDINGGYALRNVPSGSYRVRATYVGYRSESAPLQANEEGTLRLDFRLLAAALESETVVVTAQASGQNAAINQQLSTDQITNVVSAARIRELPDANAAESVGRLPGVSVLRNGGEGTEVVIRGLQPKYNAITIDGVRMASSDPNDRSTDLSMISSYSLQGIEVTKAVTPDQDADVLGGTVNFSLREARGERPGLGYNLLVQGGYNGLTDAVNKHNNYKYSGSIEGRFFNERLGVFAQADLGRRNLASNQFGASYDHLGNSQTAYVTTGFTLNDFGRDRERENGSLVLDYRLPDGKISLSNFFSSGSTDIQNRGELYDIQDNLHDYSLSSSASTLNLITNVLGVEQQLPVFHATMKFSHAYSETRNPDDWTVWFLQSPAGLGQFIGRANLYPSAIPGAATNDVSATYLWGLDNTASFSRERSLAASLDLQADPLGSDMANAVIKFGGKLRYQTRSYQRDEYSGQFGLANSVSTLVADHFAATVPYANSNNIPIGPFLDPGFSYGKFLGGDYPMIFPQSYSMLSELVHFLRGDADYIAGHNLFGYWHDTYNSTTWNYDGNEDQRAFYIMATVHIGPDITVIPGVRYQDLRTTYTAPRGQQNVASTLGGAYYHYDTTLSVNHEAWLPDVLLRYRPLSWCDVRLSYTNTVSYPDYSAMVPRIDVPSTGGSISFNNYRLNPTRSTNYDAYASFYDNSIGLLTAGVFLKRITDLIYPWNFYVSDAAVIPYYPPYLSAAAPTGQYNVLTSVNDTYPIDDRGVELDWQTHFWYLPHPFDGLVLNVNFTHIFSKAQYPITILERTGSGPHAPTVILDTTFTDRLLDQPDNLLNLSLGYDFEGFSVRVSMLYTADIFSGSNFWPQLRTTTTAYTRWDLSVRQNLPLSGLQIYGDINNINGIDDISVINAPTGAPQSQESYGLTADVGLRWQF